MTGIRAPRTRRSRRSFRRLTALAGDGAIVDVAGDDYRVDCAFGCEGDELIEHMGLVFEERDVVELAAEVPIGGV